MHMEGDRRGLFINRTLDNQTIMMPTKEDILEKKPTKKFDLNDNHFILGKIP